MAKWPVLRKLQNVRIDFSTGRIKSYVLLSLDLNGKMEKWKNKGKKKTLVKNSWHDLCLQRECQN